ncbi:MAG: M48 family metallopeptidase [Deltaproteobacteria bacterium]|nr:M48 family metallopeptidase [Deltaproteobacteria bacterium]
MAVFESSFFWVFLGFYLLHELVFLTLEALNYRYAKAQNSPPDLYTNLIGQAEFLRAKDYTLEKTRFAMAAHFAKIPFFWILIFRNGFNAFDYYAAIYGGYGALSHSVLFCLFIAAYFFIINFPFKLYSIFVIEEKYGFNKMTLGLFFLDLIKVLILTAIIGVPLLYLVFFLMQQWQASWWVWVWAVLTLFQVVMAAIYPRFLAPLFNKFEELKDEDLKDKIQKLAKSIDFQLSGIFVVDGSKRSGHSNAYFAGMGKFRRIVLFDTLMRQLKDEELLAVLAHEMGHNVKKHIRNMMIISSIMSLVGFFVLSKLMLWHEFYEAFNIADASTHAAFVVFLLASDVFTFALNPVMNLLSRRNEYEADHFAKELTGQSEPLVEALIKLSKENLSNLTPHPLYSAYHYSHPTTVERAKALRNQK